MTRRRRHVDLPTRRIEQPTHLHTDTCQLSTVENGEVVVYRGVKAVTNWLNRVADLARERGGYVRSGPGASAVVPVPVRAPAHLARASHPSVEETPPASDTTRHDPAGLSS